MVSELDGNHAGHDSHDHQHFLILLRNESIIFCVFGFFFWVVFTLILYRAQWKAQKRRRKEDMFVVLESETGDAHYMVSFYTKGDYTEPPTGVVEMHLLGSLYPGKIHELVAHSESTKETFHLFPPLCRDKFLVTEDVCLGRIIGIVLKTTVVGPHPTWNCESVIVRDIHTNEAWYFHVHREVEYPSRMFLPATHDELCTFKFSFRRRLRREMRNGQYALYSFWFRSKQSVYTMFQRCTTAMACYMLLFVTSFFFLDGVWPPVHDLEKEKKLVKTNNKNGDHSVSTYDMLTQLKYWGKHIWCSALVASVITTLASFALVSTFRQQSKYENKFEEMDYVIGTALHEADHMKEVHMSKAAAESLKGSLAQIVSRTDGNDWERRGSEERRRFSIQQEEKWTQVMFRHIRRLNPFARHEIRDRSNSMQRQTTISMLEIQDDMEDKSTRAPSTTSVKHANSLASVVVSAAASIHSQAQRSAVLRSESHVGPRSALTPLEQRVEMRKLFMGRNIHDHFVTNETFGRGRRNQPFKPGVNWSLDYRAGNRSQLDQMEHSGFSIPGKGKHLAYGMNQRRDGEGNTAFDAEHNPFDLGNIDPPVRKWYQPIYGWITVVLLIFLASAFIMLIAFNGVFHNGKDSTDFFAELVLSTFVAALLFDTFMAEPLKVVLVALYFSWRDRSMYKRITDKTKQRRQAAEVMLHVNST